MQAFKTHRAPKLSPPPFTCTVYTLLRARPQAILCTLANVTLDLVALIEVITRIHGPYPVEGLLAVVFRDSFNLRVSSI